MGSVDGSVDGQCECNEAFIRRMRLMRLLTLVGLMTILTQRRLVPSGSIFTPPPDIGDHLDTASSQPSGTDSTCRTKIPIYERGSFRGMGSIGEGGYYVSGMRFRHRNVGWAL